VVFWVGAGLSQPALPSWVKLRDMLIAQAMETLTTLETSEAEKREDALTSASLNEDLWDAFETIKGVMGGAEFSASIRDVFEKADSINIPDIYNDIWSLDGVNGVVTLNIDGMVGRSHRRVRPGQDIAEFVGRDAQDYAHIVGAQNPSSEICTACTKRQVRGFLPTVTSLNYSIKVATLH
jgi:predicted GTPase